MPIDTSLTLTTDTLVTSPGYTNYDWIDCSTNLSIVNGYDNSFEPNVSGNYKVIIEDANGCFLESCCIQYSFISVAEQFPNKSIHVFPNPAQNFTRLACSGNTIKSHVELTDLYG